MMVYLNLIQRFVDPTKIERWAIANFSARCDINSLVRDFIRVGGLKGIVSSATFL